MILQTDFVKFVCDLDRYIGKELTFFEKQGFECSYAHLEDIDIHFTHYASLQEAKQKWEQRCKRIDKNNLFIYASEMDGLTKQDIINLGKVQARGIVVFTAKDYPDIPYALYVEEFHKNGEVGNILSRNYLNDSRAYEKWFDFVKWFNEADGGNYDIQPYKR